MTVRQVDRIQIVVRPVGQLLQPAAVDIDLVQVERLLVVRLEAEQDFLSIPRQIRTPEGTVQRQLRHQLAQMPVRRQPFQNQQPAAGNRHIAQSVSRLVRPFAPIGKRHVDKQDLVEVDSRVLERDVTFHFPHAEVQFCIRTLHLLGQLLQLNEARRVPSRVPRVGRRRW